jgi:peptide deformylase
MTVRAIRLLGDPVLRGRCQPVTAFNESLAALVTDLIETCRLPGRAGLAAPQIGVSRRVFSYNVEDVEGYVVNPVIIHMEGDQGDEDEEGCLSIPDLHFPTPRAMRAVVVGVDIEGKRIEIDGRGLLARCFQHEVDHLDGTLYIDRLVGRIRKEALRATRNANIADSMETP